ncbi:mating type 1-2 [Fusarium longipes]|uniref:Mating type 1-2 n=1 Tax=Fusarium longipes TaxID=694270 RepID=A0A395RUN5_9HYPO|nr:mating type 1-2 [Fusarium longipes]
MSSLVLMSPGSANPIVYNTHWTSEHIDSVFQCLAAKEKQFHKFIDIPMELYDQMDEGAKAALANLFMVEFGEPVLYARDNEKNCFYLGVARDLIGDGGMLLSVQGAREAIFMKRPELSKNRVHIPRPPNAYILYRKERHQIVKDKRPDITNNEISQVLGQCWNAETPSVRLYYKKKADELKEEHKRLHPDYQYRPRRPSERRRRKPPHTILISPQTSGPAPAQLTHQPQFAGPSQVVNPAQFAAAVAAQQNNA